MRRRLALTATSAALGALTLHVGSSNAQPSAGTLRLVVPYAAGGVGDQLARAVAERIAVPLGQRVLVDNKPGGGTVIGTQAALVAPADGQTVLFVAASFVIQPQLAAKPVYDPVRDFTPVALMASNPHLLVVHPSVPATTLKELAAWAQARQGSAAFASFGNGSSGHLGFELLKKAAGFEMVHVPYKGGAPAMQDLLAGQVATMLTDLPQALAQVRAGKLRAIAVASAARDATLPEVPTLQEAGLTGFTSQSWYGLVVRSGTPAALLQRLQVAVDAALRDRSLHAALEPAGLDFINQGGAVFAAFMARDGARYGEAIRLSGIKPE